MFNKLLSNLPFNPSLINQVAFYSKRLKQEASVRRLGFILMLAVLALQMFTILSPAQPSLAVAGNDLIPGGFSSKAQLVSYCYSHGEYQAILAYFAISCGNLQNNSAVGTIRSTDTKNGQVLYSMGRQAQGFVNQRTGRPTDEVAVPISGSTYFMRQLHSFDSGSFSSYTALSVGNAFGVQFYILFTCGNLVNWGRPPAPAPPPAPTPPPPTPTPTPTPKPHKPCARSQSPTDVTSCITKSKQASNTTQQIGDANHTTANAGDIIVYRLLNQNRADVAAKNYQIQDDFSDVLEYATIVDKGGAKLNGGMLTWPATTIPAKSTLVKQVTIKVKNPIPKTPEPCNPAVVHPCPITGSFDLLMTNVYNNEINIKVKPPVEKTVEITTTKTLINTGPGANLVIGFLITTVVGYFFARSRMMATELDLVRSDYTSGGF